MHWVVIAGLVKAAADVTDNWLVDAAYVLTGLTLLAHIYFSVLAIQVKWTHPPFRGAPLAAHVTLLLVNVFVAIAAFTAVQALTNVGH
jgi:hypothetical protein